MKQKDIKRDLTRIVYWYNRDRRAINDQLVDAGYTSMVKHQNATPLERQAGRHGYSEVFVYRDGALVALIHRFDDEAFTFLWTPEARAPRLRQAIWRLTHPATPVAPAIA